MTDERKFAAMERAMAGDAAPPEPNHEETMDTIAERIRALLCMDNSVSRIASWMLGREHVAAAAERARCVAILRKALSEIEGTTP